MAISLFIHVYYNTFEMTYFFKYHTSYCNTNLDKLCFLHDEIYYYSHWVLALCSFLFLLISYLLYFLLDLLFRSRLLYYLRITICSSTIFRPIKVYRISHTIIIIIIILISRCRRMHNARGVIRLHNICSHVICPTLLYYDCSCWVQDDRPFFFYS